MFFSFNDEEIFFSSFVWSYKILIYTKKHFLIFFLWLLVLFDTMWKIPIPSNFIKRKDIFVAKEKLLSLFFFVFNFFKFRDLNDFENISLKQILFIIHKKKQKWLIPQSLFFFLSSDMKYMTLAGKMVPVPEKVPPKKTPFLSQWRVLGEGVSDRKIKVFLIFFCFLLDFSVFPICCYIVRSKTPFGPNLSLTEKPLFLGGTISEPPFWRASYVEW